MWSEVGPQVWTELARGLWASGAGTSGLTNGGQGAWAGLCPWRGLAGEHKDPGSAPAPAGAQVLSPPWTALPWLRPVSGASSGAWNRPLQDPIPRGLFQPLRKICTLQRRFAKGPAEWLSGHQQGRVAVPRVSALGSPGCVARQALTLSGLLCGRGARLPALAEPFPLREQARWLYANLKALCRPQLWFPAESEAEVKCRVGEPRGRLPSSLRLSARSLTRALGVLLVMSPVLARTWHRPAGPSMCPDLQQVSMCFALSAPGAATGQPVVKGPCFPCAGNFLCGPAPPGLASPRHTPV